MNCLKCGKKIVLVPSAAERAAKDVTGKSAAYYTSLFTVHPECQVKAWYAKDADEDAYRSA